MKRTSPWYARTSFSLYLRILQFIIVIRHFNLRFRVKLKMLEYRDIKLVLYQMVD